MEDECNKQKKKKQERRCRGSNPGHPRDRREYSPLYYNDVAVMSENDKISNYIVLTFLTKQYMYD